ncbi:MAG: hypothetical protein ACI8YQ_001607 [Polaribacter sp.]|jgi:hypothetical protein
MLKHHLTLPFLLLSLCPMAQTQLPINNASFEEGIAKPGKRNTEIPGWIDCGSNNETAPDVHSELSAFHNVKHSAAHDFNFLMMVTRDNDTQEMIGAPLSQELKKDSNYLLTLQLAKPAAYISRSKKLKIDMEYTKGVILRIFGGDRVCETTQLLAESPVINDVDWNEHQFLLMPQQDFEFLFLQAYYDDEAQEPYNGSILLDNVQVFNKGAQHQAMHSMVSSGKQYEWHSVLKIDETIAELVPEGMERFPGDGDMAGHFQKNYSPLLFQYELMKLEQFFTKKNTLVDFIKQTSPEDLMLTIEALRYIHAHRTATVVEEMYQYFQLQQSSAITKLEAAYQIRKLEKTFSTVMKSDEVIVKRIRNLITYRAKYLQEIRMAMIDLLGGRDVLNFAKKNP